MIRRTVFGSFNIGCVIVPALMNDVRSCGMRGVPWVAAVWLGNTIGVAVPVTNGVMLAAGMVGVLGELDPGFEKTDHHLTRRSYAALRRKHGAKRNSTFHCRKQAEELSMVSHLPGTAAGPSARIEAA